MQKALSPGETNEAYRLVLIAKHHGSEFLDNPESFDRTLGPGAFAELDAHVLDMVRGMVEDLSNHAPGNRLRRG